MTILIIIAISILFLTLFFQLNSRVNALENKFKNIRIINHEKNDINQNLQINNVNNISVPENIETIEKTEDRLVPVSHQDNFAKNLARFAIVVLTLGVVFFLKYLDNHGFLSNELKYVAGLIFGGGLLFVAEYIKDKNKQYTNILRGGSFVILYTTIFIGFVLFSLTSWMMTLSLITLVLIASVIISYRDNISTPFTMGSLGAYLILYFLGANYSIHKGTYMDILSYVFLLNLAIIFISLKKDWIKDTVIGFIFSWMIYFSIFEDNISKITLFIFATLYGLQYLIIFLLQDFKNNENSKITVFLTSINTLIYLSVFYSIIVNTYLFDYIGYFTAILGVFHLIVFNMLNNRANNNFIKLTHFVVGVLILTASIPLQFDGPIVTMIWFLEGVVLAFLAVLKSFKDQYLMYVLSFISIILGIMHMIMFGIYENVFKTGRIFINQNYIVWFAVFILINLIVYIWYQTIDDSLNIDFKKSIKNMGFTLIIIGQIMFIVLTSVEISDFGSYRRNIVSKNIQESMEIDRKLSNYDKNDEYSNYKTYYDNEDKYKNDYEKINTINNQTTFMHILLFIFMTIIYFIIGLLKKNKIIRNMGILTLIITSILLIGLTWQLGAIYRIITFIGLGLLLLIISYLYISKNNINKIALFTLIFISSMYTNTLSAKTIDIKQWSHVSNIVNSPIVTEGNNDNVYILPIDKDIIDSAKRENLTDIRIIDKDKNEIPYIIVKSNVNKQVINDEFSDVKILENSLNKDGKRVIVIDTGKEGLLYNQIILYHDNKNINFRKKVKIYVSDVKLSSNATVWREFEQKNIIYNYTDRDNFSVEDMSIDLEGVSSKYIKIELLNDVDFDRNIKVNNQININKIQIQYKKGEDKDNGNKIKDYLEGNFSFPNINIKKTVKLIDKYQAKDNTTEYIFEGETDIMGFVLDIDKTDENFNRMILLQGSNDDVNWIDIANTNIYRINSPVYKGEKLNIDTKVSTYKKLKLIIKDNNNKTLNIKNTAEILIQNTGILFKLDNGQNLSDLSLLIGNNTELAPIYDIKSIINYFENVTPNIVEYKDFIKNPEYEPSKKIIPFGERNKVFLNIGLIIFIIIIGIFGFFWMRKEK